VADLLYLHGRGDTPESHPGSLVLQEMAQLTTLAPTLDDAWLGQPFGAQVETVERWLGDVSAAAGHSWGAWLLLNAAHGRHRRGETFPPLLLLSALLGAGTLGGAGYLAPGARAVGEALGLTASDPGRAALPSDRITFVHGENDEQCPVELVRRLSGRYRVTIVPGGHRLDDPLAIEGVREALRSFTRERQVDGAVDTGW